VELERQDLIVKCAMMGLVGALIFSYLWVAAVLVDGNWIMGVETLSELGGDRRGSFLFNTGVITMGFAGLAFSSGLYLCLGSPLKGSGSIVLMVGSVALIGVGIFPITAGDPHTFFSYLFFGLMLFSLAMLVWPLSREPRIGSLGGAVTLGSIVVSLGFLFNSSVPMTEAVAVICLLIWSVTISSLILIRPSFRTCT